MGLFDKATGGTGLFGNESQWLQDERDKISVRHTRDYQDRQNPFRMLGGALKAHNLKNSPEAQQMRQTEELMKQYSGGMYDKDPTKQREAWLGLAQELKSFNPKGAVQAMQVAQSIGIPKASKLDTSVQEIDGRKLLINNQDGSTIKDLGPVAAKSVGQEKWYEATIKDNKVVATGKTLNADKDSPPKHDKPGHFYTKSPRSGINVTQTVGGTPDLKDTLAVKKDYQTQTKDARETMAVLQELDDLLKQSPTGALDKATVSKLTQAFDGGVRALANLQQWRSLGDLGQRISGGLSNFFLGTMAEGQREDFRNLINDYRKDYAKRLNKEKVKAWEFADRHKLNPVDIIGEDRYQQITRNGRTYEIDMFEQRVIREIK